MCRVIRRQARRIACRSCKSLRPLEQHDAAAGGRPRRALQHEGQQRPAGGVGQMPVVQHHGVEAAGRQRLPARRAGFEETAAFFIGADRRQRRSAAANFRQQAGQLVAGPGRQGAEGVAREHVAGQRAQHARPGGVGHARVAGAAAGQREGPVRRRKIQRQPGLSDTPFAFNDQVVAGQPGGFQGCHFGVAAHEGQRVRQPGRHARWCVCR